MRWINVRAREVFIATCMCASCEPGPLTGAQCVLTGSGLFFLLCILGRAALGDEIYELDFY